MKFLGRYEKHFDMQIAIPLHIKGADIVFLLMQFSGGVKSVGGILHVSVYTYSLFLQPLTIYYPRPCPKSPTRLVLYHWPVKSDNGSQGRNGSRKAAEMEFCLHSSQPQYLFPSHHSYRLIMVQRPNISYQDFSLYASTLH